MQLAANCWSWWQADTHRRQKGQNTFSHTGSQSNCGIFKTSYMRLITQPSQSQKSLTRVTAWCSTLPTPRLRSSGLKREDLTRHFSPLTHFLKPRSPPSPPTQMSVPGTTPWSSASPAWTCPVIKLSSRNTSLSRKWNHNMRRLKCLGVFWKFSLNQRKPHPARVCVFLFDLFVVDCWRFLTWPGGLFRKPVVMLNVVRVQLSSCCGVVQHLHFLSNHAVNFIS